MIESYNLCCPNHDDCVSQLLEVEANLHLETESEVCWDSLLQVLEEGEGGGCLLVF